MMHISKLIFSVLLVFIISDFVKGQTVCTALGQNPTTAFPVCGTSTFSQGTVPYCGGRTVPGPCPGTVLTDVNPYWYQFTCFGSGTFAFVITPNIPNDDYDWQLFDITGRNAIDIYTDASLFVACNWSGDGGTTGASAAGTSLIRCDGPGVPRFTSMPNLIVNHTYILLVSHFTSSPNGYSLSFGGGTSVITDPVSPHIDTVTLPCTGDKLFIKLNKKMKCTSLTASGSDFSISPASATIISAVGVGCSSGFDMDSIVLTLNQPLPAGNYTLSAQNGTDGNTLFDICNNRIPVGETLPFTVISSLPAPMDSIKQVSCAPSSVELYFATPVKCNSIAANGSDFIITGTYPVTVSGATAVNCINGLTNGIIVQFASPLQQQGNFQIKLQSGTDGNTLLNSCLVPTAAGAALSFSVKDTVNAGFTKNVLIGCQVDTVNFSHPGGNGITSWNWTFEDGTTSTAQFPQKIYTVFGNKQATLTVSNGFCSSTVVMNYVLAPNGPVTAAFTASPVICSYDTVFIQNTSTGVINSWSWDFGDGQLSSAPAPGFHLYNPANTYLIKLLVTSAAGCRDSITQQVIVNPQPVAYFKYNLPVCETRSISFIDSSFISSGTVTGWAWNFNDPASGLNNTSASQNPQHVFSAVGSYNVQLIVTSANGCRDTLIKTITVYPQPMAGFILPEVCLSDAFAQFIDTTTILAPDTFSWQWDFGDPASGVLNTAALQNPPHRYNAIGNYVATLIVTSNHGCIDTIAQPFTVNGDIPVANFNPLPGNFCANQLVAIQNMSTVNFGSVTKVEIYWDNTNNPAVFEKDDVPTPGKIYTHAYPDFQTPATKTFTIRFRAYSGATCVNDRIKNIVVNASPKVQFTVVPDICPDAAPYQLIQASEIGGVAGTGVFSGIGVSSTGLFNPAIAGPGVFTIKYVFTSNFGCADSATQTIKVFTKPIANFGFSAPTCQTKNVTFTDSSAAGAGTIVSWLWNFGDGTPTELHTNANAFTHAFSNSGVFTVSLTVTTNNGCKTSKTKQITITPNPMVNFSIAPGCLPNASIGFTNLSSIVDGTENSFLYLWDFGDPASGANNSSVAKTPLPHIYTTVGPYNVKLTVTSGKGCVADTIISTGTGIHPQPVADFTSDSSSLCVNQSVQFADASNGSDGILNSWLWSYGDGQTDNVQYPPPHTYTDTITYFVQLQVANNFGCRDTVVKPFVVYPYPVVNAGPDITVLEGGQIQINATATGSLLQYSWSPALYLNNTAILRPTVLNMRVDTITYLLTVKGIGGCTVSDRVLVKLLRVPVIPNTFTPNGDGINDSWFIRYLDSYPNLKLQIFNRYGQVLYENNGYYKPWDGTFKGKPLPFGTYYYIMEPGSDRDPITGYVTIIR